MPIATRSPAKHRWPNLRPQPSAKASTFSSLMIYLHMSKFVFDDIVRHGTWLAHLPAPPASVPMSQGGIRSGFNAHGEV